MRIELKGSVILRAGDHAQQGRIVNLSQGGLLAAMTVGPPGPLAGSVEIALRLDGQHAQWLHASGRIVRASGEEIAIAFDAPPPGLARMIDDMSTASHARLRVMSVVLVDAELARRSVLAAAFHAIGCTVIETSTPLEAIVRLGESNFEPDLIAIADSTPTTVADELRRFVGRHHPQVKLVTIGDELAEPPGSGHWLSSADPASDLAKRLREMLGRPRRPTQS
jgi:hypothetical protein